MTAKDNVPSVPEKAPEVSGVKWRRKSPARVRPVVMMAAAKTPNDQPIYLWADSDGGWMLNSNPERVTRESNFCMGTLDVEDIERAGGNKLGGAQAKAEQRLTTIVEVVDQANKWRMDRERAMRVAEATGSVGADFETTDASGTRKGTVDAEALEWSDAKAEENTEPAFAAQTDDGYQAFVTREDGKWWLTLTFVPDAGESFPVYDGEVDDLEAGKVQAAQSIREDRIERQETVDALAEGEEPSYCEGHEDDDGTWFHHKSGDDCAAWLDDLRARNDPAYAAKRQAERAKARIMKNAEELAADLRANAAAIGMIKTAEDDANRLQVLAGVLRGDEDAIDHANRAQTAYDNLAHFEKRLRNARLLDLHNHPDTLDEMLSDVADGLSSARLWIVPMAPHTATPLTGAQ